MNFRSIARKNIKSYTDTKVKLINKLTQRATSPKRSSTAEKRYRLILDIVLTEPSIPNKTPTLPVTPPPTRSTTPEPLSYSTRKITIYGRECEVDLPIEMDIYEGLRLYYPLLYTMVMDEEKEIAYETKVNYYEHEQLEQSMNYMDYLEWIYD